MYGQKVLSSPTGYLRNTRYGRRRYPKIGRESDTIPMRIEKTFGSEDIF